MALEVTASQPIVICGAGPAALVFARRFLHLTANTTSSTTTSTPPRVILLEKRPRPLRYSETKATSCEVGDNAFGFGGAQLVERLENGAYAAGSDPRKDGQAAGF